MLNNFLQIEQSILSTFVFFDIFNYPLTMFEVWKWRYQAQNSKLKTQNYNLKLKTNIERHSERFAAGERAANTACPVSEESHGNFQSKISEIQEILEKSDNLRKIVETKNGFYFLKRREGLVARRRDLYRDAEERWKKLRRVANILQYVPNIKMIAACNTLPINDFKPESDIDAFLIVKKNRLWLSRFLITLIVGLLGQWRHKKNIAKKICLSFYVTDEALSLESITKKPYDIYLTYWVTLVAPLYADRNIYQQFLNANSWVKNYLPNFFGYEPVEFERKTKEIEILKAIKKILEKILDFKFGNLLEKVLKKIQKNKMMKNYQSTYYRNDLSVIISDQMLKFHEVDRRDDFRQEFELRLAKIIKETNCG